MKIILKTVRWVVALFFASTLLAVVAYRFLPVYVTPLMFIRCAEQLKNGESLEWHHHWVALDEMSAHMPVAVMASEDQRFLLHHGFDFDAIQKAAEHQNKQNQTWGQHHIAANSQECVPVAGQVVGAQRI